MLDTLKYAKRLQEAGFTPPQAEAQAQALWEAIEGTVATKQDLELLRQEIKELETRMDGRFRLQNWMIGFNLALTVAVLAKLLVG
jgi:hypothetical protein